MDWDSELVEVGRRTSLILLSEDFTSDLEEEEEEEECVAVDVDKLDGIVYHSFTLSFIWTTS